jgi:ATP-dependent DNA helicase RecQ
VIRQLIALGHLASEGEYNTLALTDSARAVLRGEVKIELRELREPAGRGKSGRAKAGAAAKSKVVANLDATGQARFAALKTWRSEVAKEHNLPAYIVFNDATLAQMAAESPDSLSALAGISGVGAKKLEAYGRQILRVLETLET